jgi:hypothetical protein
MNSAGGGESVLRDRAGSTEDSSAGDVLAEEGKNGEPVPGIGAAAVVLLLLEEAAEEEEEAEAESEAEEDEEGSSEGEDAGGGSDVVVAEKKEDGSDDLRVSGGDCFSSSTGEEAAG